MDVEKCVFLPSLDYGLPDHDHWFRYQTALPSREIMTKILADGLFSCCAIGSVISQGLDPQFPLSPSPPRRPRRNNENPSMGLISSSSPIRHRIKKQDEYED